MKPLCLYSVNDYVQALAQVVDAISPTPFVLAHSLGGAVLQHYLKTCSLPGAVLLASAPVSGLLRSFSQYMARHPWRLLRAALTLNAGLSMNTPALVREYLLTDDAAIAPEVLASRLQNESFRAGLESTFFVKGDPDRVKTPLLVVAGECDGVFALREEQQTAEAYRADFLTIPNQGHDLMLERNWQQTASQIRAWLDRHQPN